MTDYPNAIWMPNTNFFQSTGKKRMIVIHGTAGGNNAQGVAEYFKDTEGTINPVSSHYIVDQAGTIVQTVLESNGAWGNGVVNNPQFEGENPNDYTISIEHVKSTTDNSALLTDAQKAASFALIKDICKRNTITYDNIIPHALIDPVNRSRCPGPYPWDELKIYLEGIIMDAHVEQAARDEWNAITTVPTGSGIWDQWFADYQKGIFHGPAMSHEKSTVDWQGNPIIKQYFLYHHVEWNNGLVGWYGPEGKI